MKRYTEMNMNDQINSASSSSSLGSFASWMADRELLLVIKFSILSQRPAQGQKITRYFINIVLRCLLFYKSAFSALKYKYGQQQKTTCLGRYSNTLDRVIKFNFFLILRKRAHWSLSICCIISPHPTPHTLRILQSI